MKDEITKALSEGSVLAKTYDDLAHPTLKSLGNTLSLVPRTVGVWLSGWEKWVINGEESIRLTAQAVGERAKDIPEEHLIEPHAHIAVPAIQQLAYSYDSAELREMYANLLLSSMDDRTAELAHPCFVQMLKELCPDEAKLLKALVPSEPEARPTIPLLDLRIVKIDQMIPYSWKLIFGGYNECCKGVCEYPQQSLVYLGNLERLGILERLDVYSEEDAAKFEKYENSATLASAKDDNPLKDGERYDFRRWSYQVTDFGLGFMKACVA